MIQFLFATCSLCMKSVPLERERICLLVSNCFYQWSHFSREAKSIGQELPTQQMYAFPMNTYCLVLSWSVKVNDNCLCIFQDHVTTLCIRMSVTTDHWIISLDSFCYTTGVVSIHNRIKKSNLIFNGAFKSQILKIIVEWE